MENYTLFESPAYPLNDMFQIPLHIHFSRTLCDICFKIMLIMLRLMLMTKVFDVLKKNK